MAIKTYLSGNVLGRMLLHLGCLCRGGQFRFHVAGIRRAGRECCGLGTDRRTRS
jgi:hypothetical protein